LALAVEQIREITGTAVPIRGDDIDTDRIIPARFLKSITFEGLEQHLFEDDRLQSPSHPLSNPVYTSARIMLVNANFGCGSSREHAPQAILRSGIRAVVGQSFSEIFSGNSVAIGLACPTASADALRDMMDIVERDPATTVTVDLASMKVTCGGKEYPLSLPSGARDALVNGSWDATGQLLEDFAEVRAVAARLPYVSGAW
jgi:3-isopropylmalate/(R)-2-methylmalate dehydratase small subunit